MSAEENKAVVRRMIEEVWNDHDFTNFEEVVAQYHFDHMAVPEHQRGVAGERHVIEWLLTVFPDHRFDLEDAAGDGETVAVRGTCSGTHEGELWGIPPTGQRFAVQQSHWFRIVDGKVAEHWAVRDDLVMLRQLGILPSQPILFTQLQRRVVPGNRVRQGQRFMERFQKVSQFLIRR